MLCMDHGASLAHHGRLMVETISIPVAPGRTHQAALALPGTGTAPFPGVVVIHEVPGIIPSVIEFADDVVERGFTVVMPDLVGTPGRPVSGLYLASSVVKVCVSREITS